MREALGPRARAARRATCSRLAGCAAQTERPTGCIAGNRPQAVVSFIRSDPPDLIGVALDGSVLALLGESIVRLERDREDRILGIREPRETRAVVRQSLLPH